MYTSHAYTPYTHTHTYTSHTHIHAVVSEYAEFDDEHLETALDEATTLVNPGLYDEDETRARRDAYRKHIQRSRSREVYTN